MLRLDNDKRRALLAAKAQVRELERPERERQKIARAKARRKREAAIDRAQPEQRQPRERDAGYLAWLRRLPCIAGVMGRTDCEGAVQAAHVRFSAHGKGHNPGLGSKNHDRHANPLCAFHHLQDQHTRSEIAFWADLGVDAYDLSAALYAAYRAGEDGLAVLRRFSPSKPGRKLQGAGFRKDITRNMRGQIVRRRVEA